MVNLLKGKTATQIAIGLAACWLLPVTELAAQTPRVLVVVADAGDADCVKRIGCEHVRVEHLFAPETGAKPSNYEACDKRVSDLLDFRLLVFRGDTYCPAEGFWRERMTGANPRGKVYRLSQLRSSAINDCEHMIQQATDIHGALTSILPKHQATLDANLKSELQRLYLLRLHPYQFALRE